MPRFGTKSENKLKSLHPTLMKVLREAIKYIDFTIVETLRSKQRQDEAYALGRSKVKYPNSKHNSNPSRAVDIAPWDNGINWKNTEEFVYLAGMIMGIASTMDVKLRWGGDWDHDNDLDDERFRDYGHFEMV